MPQSRVRGEPGVEWRAPSDWPPQPPARALEVDRRARGLTPNPRGARLLHVDVKQVTSAAICGESLRVANNERTSLNSSDQAHMPLGSGQHRRRGSRLAGTGRGEAGPLTRRLVKGRTREP